MIQILIMIKNGLCKVMKKIDIISCTISIFTMILIFVSVLSIQCGSDRVCEKICEKNGYESGEYYNKGSCDCKSTNTITEEINLNKE